MWQNILTENNSIKNLIENNLIDIKITIKWRLSIFSFEDINQIEQSINKR